MSAIANLFSAPKVAPTIIAPTPRAPAPLPTQNDRGVLDAQKRRRRQLSSRQGRASTILTDRQEFKNVVFGQ